MSAVQFVKAISCEIELMFEILRNGHWMSFVLTFVIIAFQATSTSKSNKWKRRKKKIDTAAQKQVSMRYICNFESA